MNLTASSMNRMAYTRREPIGVVAAVSAFNHPFNLIVHQVVPAVAVGCPVIIKPSIDHAAVVFQSRQLPVRSRASQRMVPYPVCDNEVAEKLVTDSRVAFFSFIGSSKVGWHLRSKLAPGTRCALEHGGAAPVIMDEGCGCERRICLYWQRAASIMPGRFACPCNAYLSMSPSSMTWPRRIGRPRQKNGGGRSHGPRYGSRSSYFRGGSGPRGRMGGRGAQRRRESSHRWQKESGVPVMRQRFC